MTERDSFPDSICKEQMYLAERELSSFLTAVTDLYGPEQARLSVEDWLDASGLTDSAPLSGAGNWRAATIAASARLANRLNDRDASLDTAPRFGT